MTSKQMRDFELIGEHEWPGDQIEVFRLISQINKYDAISAAAYGYILGVMHGKQAERSKRK